MNTLYTVKRARADDTLYGPAHGAMTDQATVCGQSLDHNWWITHNAFDGEITCRKCLTVIEQKPHWAKENE